jgi:hypothetical protein
MSAGAELGERVPNAPLYSQFTFRFHLTLIAQLFYVEHLA